MSALSTSLLLPWHTVHRSLRWLGGGVSLLLVIAAVVVALYSGKPRGWTHGMTLYAFAAAYFWMCVMACLLLVAVDVRRLCAPGAQHALLATLLSYAGISVALPLALFVPMGGDAFTIALVAALASVAGFAAALLPRWMVLPLGFLPAVVIGARRFVHVPLPTQPGFPAWGSAIWLVLAVACALRWRALVRAGDAAGDSAMVLKYRQNGAMANGWTTGLASAAAHSPPPSRRNAAAVVRVDGAGPWNAASTIRVALGEYYAPLAPRGYLLHFSRIGLPLLLFIPVLALIKTGESASALVPLVLHVVGIGVISWLGTMSGIALMAVYGLQPRTYWRQRTAELSLLALLPGLGDATHARRALRRAALVRPLTLLGGLLAVCLLTAGLMHAGWLLWVFLALGQLGFGAFVVVCTLDAFGGKPLPGWALVALGAVVCALQIASTFAGLNATLTRHAQPLAAGMLAAFALAWSALAATLAWLARRGWRGMQARPHVFLAN